MIQEERNILEKKILTRYGIIVAFLLIFAVAVLSTATKLIFSEEGKNWRLVGEKETVIKDRVILPIRGNIFTYDGKLLATSEPLYNIYIDFWSEGMTEDTLRKYATDLSIQLAKKFPGRTSSQYKSILLKGWSQREKEERKIADFKARGVDKKVPLRSRYVRLIKQDITYVDLKELRTLPFLNKRSNQSGLITEEKNSRRKPFGSLATRTIGSVYKDLAKGGASGLELKYDSLLRGVNGVKFRQKIQGKWMDVVEEPAQEGFDIQTTLDANIQDITERALRQKLIETDAESGTAIIMDTKTGEIRGISNLDRLAGGGYGEGNPNAFSYMNEPGSTFKGVTVMAALDDGLITMDETFAVGTGLFQYKNRVVKDHDWYHGKNKGNMTVVQGMENSSNVVMAKIAIKGYEDNPKKFIEAIDRIGLRKKLTWDVPLHGIEGTSRIRYPNDKANPWSKTTLAWMAFGYETQIPPIYMLMFYNGIANGGKMIKPFITKAILKDGKVIEEKTAQVVKEKMCKDTTLTQMKYILERVVSNGTGKPVHSNYFTIAGKTGTAQIAQGGGYGGHYVSFCGYFPAENPQYTCFVGIRKPRIGYPSGGMMSGGVFKTIAEQIFVRSNQLWLDSVRTDTLKSIKLVVPPLKSGNSKKAQMVLSGLGFRLQDYKSSPWIQVQSDSLNYVTRPLYVYKNIVPNVVGMGARDAVYLLESVGLKARISGKGKIVSQSLLPGQRAVKGTPVILTLN